MLRISLSLSLPRTHSLSTYSIILFIKSPLRYIKIDLTRLLIIGITIEKEINKKRYERSTDERKERTVQEREKKPREEMQREWRTLERGRVGKIGVGENRGRWVLAALWRAPGVAPRRFGASNAETLR